MKRQTYIINGEEISATSRFQAEYAYKEIQKQRRKKAKHDQWLRRTQYHSK